MSIERNHVIISSEEKLMNLEITLFCPILDVLNFLWSFGFCSQYMFEEKDLLRICGQGTFCMRVKDILALRMAVQWVAWQIAILNTVFTLKYLRQPQTKECKILLSVPVPSAWTVLLPYLFQASSRCFFRTYPGIASGKLLGPTAPNPALPSRLGMYLRGSYHTIGFTCFPLWAAAPSGVGIIFALRLRTE